MSDLIAEVDEIRQIEQHPDPETTSLEVATVKGWKSVIRKGEFKQGDLCVFIPPDAILGIPFLDKLGSTKYCAELPKAHELRSTHRRVKAANIRGTPSFGLLLHTDVLPTDRVWSVGDSVLEVLGITKWVPPVKVPPEDASDEDPLFQKYTKIQNYANYPDYLKKGEEVVITEKIHGSNFGAGYKWESGIAVPICRSHDTQRKFDKDKPGRYGIALLDPNFQSLCFYIALQYPSARYIVAYGEIYGPGVQGDMTYGAGKLSYALFDISVDGVYLDYRRMLKVCEAFHVPTVPHLYMGPFSDKILRDFTEGPTTMCGEDKLPGFKGREGVVVKPTTEMHVGRIGRLVLKSVSASYLNRKKAVDNGE